MNNKKHAQWGILGATLALTAGALAIVPGAPGPVDEPIDAAGSLVVPAGTITIDGSAISFSEGGTQALANGQGCKLATDGSLLAFSGGGKSVGFVDGSVGVKSKGNGQDCGQIDGAEALSIELGTDVSDKVIFRADLDVEVLQDAGLTATAILVDGGDEITLGSFTLLTGSQVPSGATGVDNTPMSTTSSPESYCNPASSSGPNSAEADNCYWTIESDSPFNKLVLTETGGGKASLQGGDDWPAAGPGGPTILHLTEAFDGILDCGDVIEVGDASLGGVITRLGVPSPSCELKPYNFQVDEDRVEFEPSGAPGAQYSGVITKSVPEPLATDPTSIEWIEYDKDGDGTAFGFVPMQWCENDDLLVGSTLPATLDTDGQAATWCVYAVDLSDPSGGNVTASYSVYGEDDPHWR